MRNLRLYPYLQGLVFLLVIGAVLVNGAAVCAGMGNAVIICLETMIPSLYAMMICSELFLSWEIDRMVSAPLHKPARFLFGCSGQILVIFLLSQVAGYPIGAKMLTKLVQDGTLSKRQASWLAGVCFGGGPAFLAALFAEHPGDMQIVFLAGFLSNLLLFCCMIRFLHADAQPVKDLIHSGKSAAALVGAATTSGSALLRICAMVILFGGLLELMNAVGITELLAQLLGLLIHRPPAQSAQILCSFTEISQVTKLFPYGTWDLPLLGAALSFGGICVMLQIAAVTEGRLHMGGILLMRCAAAILTGTFLFLWQQLNCTEEIAPAAVIWEVPSDIQAGSPLPALFLLIMTVILLRSVRC